MKNYHIGISGPEGVGKTEAINKLSKLDNIIIIQEKARMVQSLKENILKNSKDEFSLLVYNALNASMHTLFGNSIIVKQGFNIVSDRTLIDPLVYSNLYGGDQKINIKDFKEFIKRLSDTFQREKIYDDIVLSKPLTVNQSILDIMKDPARMYSQTVDGYKKEAELWVKTYIDIAGEMDDTPLYGSLHVVDTYPINDLAKISKNLMSKSTRDLIKKNSSILSIKG
jgi:hypothetical protein